MAGIMHPFFVILAIHDTVAAQLATHLLLLVLRLGAPPALDDAKHEVSAVRGTIVTEVTLSGVMEHAVDDSVDGSVRVNTLVVPALDQLWDDPFEDL